MKKIDSLFIICFGLAGGMITGSILDITSLAVFVSVAGTTFAYITLKEDKGENKNV